MDPHPDFAETTLPREADLPGFRLTPLGPSVAEEDYEAAMASVADVSGVFGDPWPEGLTLEENRIDMGWHEREFTARRSFAWVVRSPDGTYLGCAYIYPELGRRGAADVIVWLRTMAGRDQMIGDVVRVLRAFFAEHVPDSVVLTWRTSPAT